MPGGETEQDVSAWTTDSLKEHLEAKLSLIQQHFEARIDNFEKRLLERSESQERNVEQVRQETARALAAADKAILKSEAAAEKRFDLLNEFRGQLADQAKTFISRETFEALMSALSGRVGAAETAVTELRSEKRGASDQTRAIYAIAGFISVLLVIGTVLAANGVFA